MRYATALQAHPEVLQQNPAALQPLLQAIQQQNPGLYEYISTHQEESAPASGDRWGCAYAYPGELHFVF